MGNQGLDGRHEGWNLLEVDWDVLYAWGGLACSLSVHEAKGVLSSLLLQWEAAHGWLGQLDGLSWPLDTLERHL